MVDVAQQVRALDCGSRSRGFESHLPPKTFNRFPLGSRFFHLVPLKTCFHKATDEKSKPGC